MARTDADLAWMGTQKGLYRYDISQTESTASQPKEFEKLPEVSAIAADMKGNIYIAFGSNIYVASENQNSLKEFKWKNTTRDIHERVTALALSDSGRIFIGTDRGKLVSMALYNPTDSTEVQLGESVPTSITALASHKNQLWVGTKHGLAYTDDQLSLIETYTSENSRLSNSEITTLFAEDEIVWVGTYHGLNTVSFVPFENYNQDNSGVFNDVLAFAEDANKNLWVGTFNGLYLFDKTRKKHTYFNDLAGTAGLPDSRIMTMATKDNELWLGFQNSGIQIINTESFIMRQPLIEKSEQLEVTKILHTIDGNTWVATFNQGVYKIERRQAISYLASGSLPEPSITILFQPNLGGIIASSERKIYQYSEKEGKFSALEFEFLDSKEPPLILSISESSTGDIWIGTKDHGLFIWKYSDRIRSDFTLVRSRSNINFSDRKSVV